MLMLLSVISFRKIFFNVSEVQGRGPVGLSLMAVLSENYLQKLKWKAIKETLIWKIAPKSFRRFVDDSQAPFQEKS